MKTPLWFKVMFGIALAISLTLVGLLIWGVVELVPAAVHWLERD